MKQEDKELLLKDLSARLTYGVMCSIKGHEEKYWDSILERYIINSIDKPVRITGISIDKDCIELDSLGISEIYGSDDFGGLKPYLRPMSSMTVEEMKTFPYPYYFDWIDIDRKTMCSNDECSPCLDFNEINDVTDWLNAHHFDYRGLIEKGLAIEAPKGMYK